MSTNEKPATSKDSSKPTPETIKHSTATTNVFLEGFDEMWSSGQRLMDVFVQLGMDEKSSNCETRIADPTYETAAKLIDHTLKNGGIVALPGTNSTTPDGSTGASGSTAGGFTPDFKNDPLPPQKSPRRINGWNSVEEFENSLILAAMANGVTDKAQIAYMLGTAEQECSSGMNLRETPPILNYEGRADLGNTHPGDGFKYRGAGVVQLTGRANFEKWSKITGIDLENNPDYACRPNTSLYIMVTGMRDGLFTSHGKMSKYIDSATGKRDYVGARKLVNPGEPGGLVASKAEKYYAKIDQLIARAGAGGSTTKVEPEVAQSVAQGTPPSVPAAIPPIKGSRLFVNHLDVAYIFYHQGTSINLDGTLVLKGTGVRYELAQRKRNKTEHSKSLKQLAEQIAKAHGLRLDWQADVDILYEFIDQNGLSDYELLKRECQKVGLFISDISSQPLPKDSQDKASSNVLVIKSLRNVKDTAIVIQKGSNLIDFTISDEPLDSNKTVPDAGSSLLQSESKATINPITAKVEQTKPDIDKVADKAPTGSSKEDVAAKPAPGQQVVADTNRARTKRVQGLPSKFTVITSPEILKLEPLQAVRTKEFPGVLSRIWLVTTIKHYLMDGKTEINVCSPVEVIDNTPPATAQLNAPVPLGNGKFVMPSSGIITGIWHEQRGTRLHGGTDIAGNLDSSVIAMADGIILRAALGHNGGYGNIVEITHDGGKVSRYAHLHTIAPGLKAGQPITQGTRVGGQGNTGNSRGVHLHFELRQGGGFGSNTFDPASYGLPSCNKRQAKVVAGTVG